MAELGSETFITPHEVWFDDVDEILLDPLTKANLSAKTTSKANLSAKTTSKDNASAKIASNPQTTTKTAPQLDSKDNSDTSPSNSDGARDADAEAQLVRLGATDKSVKLYDSFILNPSYSRCISTSHSRCISTSPSISSSHSRSYSLSLHRNHLPRTHHLPHPLLLPLTLPLSLSHSLSPSLYPSLTPTSSLPHPLSLALT